MVVFCFKNLVMAFFAVEVSVIIIGVTIVVIIIMFVVVVLHQLYGTSTVVSTGLYTMDYCASSSQC